jgi:hypothetical protein
MRIQSPPRRQKFATREQVDLIVAEADARGWRHVLLAILIRFEFMLRGIDVYGEWSPGGVEEGGVHYNGQRWADGLTWSMIDKDVTRFRKVISKTKRSLPEEMEFNLTLTPNIRARLLEVPKAHRTGPVIILPMTGRPPKNSGITRNFKALVRACNLPEYLRVSDCRSGGVTEAKNLAADPYALREAAQHTQMSTTDIYARDKSQGINRVLELRQKRNQNKASNERVMKVITSKGRELKNSLNSKWYRWSDSNRHAVKQGILNPSCLPFHHSGTVAALSVPRICGGSGTTHRLDIRLLRRVQVPGASRPKLICIGPRAPHAG